MAQHTLRLVVTDVVDETADAKTFCLQCADDCRDEIAYSAGQFLTVKVPRADGGHIARCYSLTTSPALDDHVAITVKRIRDGAGSNWLCDHLGVGDVLEARPPSGTFVCRDPNRELIFFAGGSGITPVLSIIREVLHTGRAHILLYYANRDEDSVIFRDRLRRLERDHGDRFSVVHWLESVRGRPTASSVAAIARSCPSAEAFLCGPQPFMDLVADELESVGFPGRRVHREKYLSLTTDPFEAPKPVRAAGDGGSIVQVTFEGSTSRVPWADGDLLLDAMLSAGLDVPYSCREGKCSACACRLVAGQVRMEQNFILNDSDLDRGLVLACQSRAESSFVQVTYEGV